MRLSNVVLGAAALGMLMGPAAARAQGPAAAAGRMIRPNYLIHVVSDVDTSLAFYRDAVGLPVSAAPAPYTQSALLQKARTAAPGATARAAALRIPGSEMQLLLVQFSGVQGKPFTQRLYDPGVTRFSINVKDIDAAFARVKDKGIIVDTTGGGPVFTQQPRNTTRAVMMRDPDGFVFEFVQGDPLSDAAKVSTTNIFNARSSLALEDTAKSLAFYKSVLGYEARDTNTVNEAVLKLEGTPQASAKSTATQPPGSTNVWFFWEFSQIARTKRAPAVTDPGASALSILVEGLPAILERAKALGTTIETAGGQPVALDGGARAVLVRSPDGLLIELLEK